MKPLEWIIIGWFFFIVVYFDSVDHMRILKKIDSLKPTEQLNAIEIKGDTLYLLQENEFEVKTYILKK